MNKMNRIIVAFTSPQKASDNEKLTLIGVQCFTQPPSLQVGQIQTLLLQTLMFLHTFAATEIPLQWPQGYSV